MHSRAVRAGFTAAGRWVLGVAAAAVARRAFSRGGLGIKGVGRAGCGAHA